MKLWEKAKRSKLALLLAAALCACLGYHNWDAIKSRLPDMPDAIKSMLAPADEAEAPAKEF